MSEEPPPRGLADLLSDPGRRRFVLGSIAGMAGGSVLGWIAADTLNDPGNPDPADGEVEETEGDEDEGSEDIDEMDDEMDDDDAFDTDDVKTEGGLYDAMAFEEAVDHLQSGGYVLYFRHEDTDDTEDEFDVGGESFVEADLYDCTLQRNLSKEGVERAKQIGSVFRELYIPISEVYSTAWCRSRHHAELAFGEPTVPDELTSDHDEVMSKEEMQDRMSEILNTPPSTGNHVVVAHTLRAFGLRESMGQGRALTEGAFALVDPEEGVEDGAMGLFKPEEVLEYAEERVVLD